MRKVELKRPQSLRGSRAKGPYIPAFARIWCRHAVGASLSIRHERPIVSRTLRRGQETSGQIAVPSDPESSACALPRVRFGFVGHTFERSIVGFLVSLGLLRLGLIGLLLMFVTAAAHALRAGADRR